jgi:hypothetical protein
MFVDIPIRATGLEDRSLQLLVDAVDPLTLGRGLDFNDVGFPVDEGGEKIACDELDLYFA